MEVAPVAATGGVVPPPGVGEGADPTPPSASSADPAVQSVAPRGPQVGEVIDLDANKAEGTAVVETGTDVPVAATGTAAATEEGEPAPVATARTAAAGEAGTPAPVAAMEEEVATETGTSARGVPAEVAPAAEAEVPAPEAPTGAETPASSVATEGEAATGMVALAAASEVVALTGRPAAASTGAGARAPRPSVSLAASGMVEPVLTVASGSTPASASATPVPKVWRGSILRWSSRDDPPRYLFTLDDTTEWRKWQAMQAASLTPARLCPRRWGSWTASSFLVASWGKSDFLRVERGLWERFNLERQRTRELSMQVAAAQPVIDDLQRHEQAAQQDARRAEAKFQAVVDKARLDREELQKTVERIRHERQKAWQERDFEAARKGEAEKMVTELGAEVGQLQSQVQGLQTAVAQVVEELGNEN
nr:nuclear pore complex protein Nup58-like [Setaria viridis]